MSGEITITFCCTWRTNGREKYSAALSGNTFNFGGNNLQNPVELRNYSKQSTRRSKASDQ